MHTINLLIANLNPRVTNLIYLLVRSALGPEVTLNCTRVYEVDDFMSEAVHQDLDLIILNPENLASTWDQQRTAISIREAANAIRSVKTLRSAPLIAVAVSAENELYFSEAGADHVLGLPFNCEDFKAAVSRLVILPDEHSLAYAVRPSFGSVFLRGWERLTDFSFSKS